MVKDAEERAFPSENDVDKNYIWIEKGMTLRDWLAGQALINTVPKYAKTHYCNLAKECYEIADAMIAERNKT